MALSILRAYENDRASLVPASVPPLKDIGKQIVTAEYKTALSEVRLSFLSLALSRCCVSQWRFEHPEEVQQREAHVDTGLETLAQLSATKLARLEDDLAREQVVRLDSCS